MFTGWCTPHAAEAPRSCTTCPRPTEREPWACLFPGPKGPPPRSWVLRDRVKTLPLFRACPLRSPSMGCDPNFSLRPLRQRRTPRTALASAKVGESSPGASKRQPTLQIVSEPGMCVLRGFRTDEMGSPCLGRCRALGVLFAPVSLPRGLLGLEVCAVDGRTTLEHATPSALPFHSEPAVVPEMACSRVGQTPLSVHLIVSFPVCGGTK